MHIKADTLDDLLRKVFEEILGNGETVTPTKGSNLELFGVMLELTQPLARVSRTERKGRLYSALGELFWYLSASDSLSFIDYYLKDGYRSDDGVSVWGAYGPRLFNMRSKINQLEQVCKLLSQRPSSRKAVIQLFNAEDISEDHADVPCTCTLQFLIRNNALDLFVGMRSNDAYVGLPHDIFTFTMLQELMARDLGIPIGRYKHVAGSLHLYDTDKDKVKEFMEEGWQDIIEMPPMPAGSQWKAIQTLTQIESRIRSGEDVDLNQVSLDPYWMDIARSLKIFFLTKQSPGPDSASEVERLSKSMVSEFFKPYIAGRKKRGPAGRV